MHTVSNLQAEKNKSGVGLIVDNIMKKCVCFSCQVPKDESNGAQ